MPEFHPVATIFPLLPEQGLEFKELVEDIRAHGLLEPIKLYEGKILDGRNRYRACEKAGVEPRFEEWSGPSATSYVLSVNLHRRHLVFDQRGAIGADAVPFFAEEAKERQRQAGRDHGRGQVVAPVPQPVERGPKARDKAAALVGMSGRSMQKFKAIREKAPELHEEIRAGTLTLADAQRQVAVMEGYPTAVERFPYLAGIEDVRHQRTAVEAVKSLEQFRDTPGFEERQEGLRNWADRVRSGEEDADEERYRREDRQRQRIARVRSALDVLATAASVIEPQALAENELMPEILAQQIDKAIEFMRRARPGRLGLEVVR